MPKKKSEPEPEEELTFEQWKQKASEYLAEKLDIDDLLDDRDPYDLAELMEEAYEDEQSPEDFIHESFAEEFEQEGYDDHLKGESLRANSDDEDDYDDDDDEDEDDDDDE